LTRLLMLVEGQSEKAFAERTLKPWLEARGVYLQRAVLLWTRRLPAGGGFRGGVSNWKQIRSNLDPLLGDTDAVVTTLLDFYALPADVPGVATHRGYGSPPEQAERIQEAMSAALGQGARFIPFLALHEFEAWLFAAPAVVAEHFGKPALETKLVQEASGAGGPEAINDGPTTHPKARLMRLHPGYSETADGPTLLEKIGLERVRASCPHFSRWLGQLEALGGRT
jgi:hypothetical protein